MNLNTYLICVTHNDKKKGDGIIRQFIRSENKKGATLLLIENGNFDFYMKYKKSYSNEKSVKVFYSKSPNKSESLNFLISEKIKTDEALIICIDDDIDYPENFIKVYKNVALNKGNNYFYGGGMILPKSYNALVNEEYRSLYQLSQFSKNDEAFKKAKSLIFLGCNFSFFKSQWIRVNGFDERFGPGSQYGIAAQESTFQKKLIYVGFKPCLITNNKVVHYPEPNSYSLKSVKKRTTQNGLTHGFSFLIESQKFLKIDFFYRLLGMSKSLIEYKLKRQKNKYLQKKYYTIGHFKALITFLRIDNKKSIYYNLEKFE